MADNKFSVMLRRWFTRRPKLIILVKEEPFYGQIGRDAFRTEMAAYEAAYNVKILVLEGVWQIHKKVVAS